MAFALIIAGRRHLIGPRGTYIGRGPENDLPLADGEVSRRHARVWTQGAQVYVQDLGSTNGTFVNEMEISGPRSVQPGDRVRVGNTILKVAALPDAVSASRPSPLVPLILITGIGLALIVGVLLLSRPRPITGPSPTATSPGILQPTLALTERESLDRARLATVLIIALDTMGEEVDGGSGSVVDPRGYILTNFHVVERGDVLSVAVNTQNQNAPPEVAYRAEVVAGDVDLDLALLRVVSLADGRPLPTSFILPSIPLGNSDTLSIGDTITILGFPEVGGATVTLTRGTVAGFHGDDLGHERGWIKTDAEIGPGNSGGAAIDEAGHLIGVPTFVSAEARTLGRIGGLRPINLARSMLSRVP